MTKETLCYFIYKLGLTSFSLKIISLYILIFIFHQTIYFILQEQFQPSFIVIAKHASLFLFILLAFSVKKNIKELNNFL